MTLILITKHCTFIKTFLYKYSIIAWIKVIYEALEKGDFSLYKLNLHSLRFSTQTFMLDLLVYLFSDWLNWEFECVCVRVCVVLFLWTYSTYLLFGNLYELIRAFCIFFSPFCGFVNYSLNLWWRHVAQKHCCCEERTNHDHQWKVYFNTYVACDLVPHLDA